MDGAEGVKESYWTRVKGYGRGENRKTGKSLLLNGGSAVKRSCWIRAKEPKSPIRQWRRREGVSMDGAEGMSLGWGRMGEGFLLDGNVVVLEGEKGE